MGKITTAVFEPGSTTANVYRLWQYSYGQTLRIQGLNLPSAVEIHFSLQETGGTSVMRVGVTKDGVTDVVIPESMLQNDGAASDYNIFAFVYLTDDTSGQTEYKIKLRVKSRPEPEVPGGGEDPDIFHEAVQKVAEYADQAAESEKQAEGWAHGREDLPERAEDNAKYYAGKTAGDAAQTAEDRKEVEKLVESVSGIDQQVEKVEELTKQAQGAADKAGKSEQASQQAQKLAESAKTAAETAATKTAEDRTAVDNAKTEVLKAEESVSSDRVAIESAKKEIDQLKDDIPTAVQDGVQKVNDARDTALGDISKTGTAHKTAVEAAGTKAVETINRTQTEAVGVVNTAKTKAVEAVETAKTEAVKTVQTEGATQTGNVTAEGQKQVKAVEDKGQEVLQSIPEDFQTQMESKLDKQQGMENAGKILAVGESGNVELQEMQGGGSVELSDYVKFDDFAKATKAGVVKINESLSIGTGIRIINGILYLNPKEEFIKTKNAIAVAPVTTGFMDFSAVQTTHQDMTDTYDPTTANTPDGNVLYKFAGKQPASYDAVKAYVDNRQYDWRKEPVLEVEITEEAAYLYVTEINGKGFCFSEMACVFELEGIDDIANARLSFAPKLISYSYSGIIVADKNGKIGEPQKGYFEIKNRAPIGWHSEYHSGVASTWLGGSQVIGRHVPLFDVGEEGRGIFASVGKGITEFTIIPYTGALHPGSKFKIYGRPVKEETA